LIGFSDRRFAVAKTTPHALPQAPDQAAKLRIHRVEDAAFHAIALRIALA
jgi:hypothetical protein